MVSLEAKLCTTHPHTRVAEPIRAYWEFAFHSRTYVYDPLNRKPCLSSRKLQKRLMIQLFMGLCGESFGRVHHLFDGRSVDYFYHQISLVYRIT